ncbi:MAG: redoxin family protein [Pseudomonadota bacterium]
MLFVSTALADDSTKLIGTRVTDLDGTLHNMGNHADSKTVMMVFLDTGCPISRKFTPTLNELYRLASKNNSELFGVFSNPDVSPDEINQFRNEFKIEFPVIYDGSGDLAKRLKPTVIPEAFLISVDNNILYRGRIDNRFAAIGKQRTNITSHDLKNALLASAKNNTPKVSYQTPVGCVAPDWESVQTKPSDITYTKDVAQILNSNCVECHREGEVAPFTLQTYEDAKRWSAMISLVTEQGIMPPWNAEHGFGQFKDERVLSEYQINILKRWAENGTPRGETINKPISPKFTASQWKLGKPDKIIKTTEPYSLPASGEDQYRYFVIPGEFTQDKVLRGIEFHPGDPSVVHHALVYMDYTGRALKADLADPEPGFSLFGTRNFINTDAYPLAGWSPGREPFYLNDGLGMWLPKGGDVVIEVHYHLSGKVTQDQSEIGFYFADKYPKQWVDGFVIGTQKISIPPNAPNYQRHFYMNVPSDLEILEITPHMHYLGKSVLAQATLPDGQIIPLIKINDWDFRWQNTYTYRQPVSIPKGSRIDAWYTYNNSLDNPANPNVTASTIRWGPQSNNEMAQLWFTVVPDNIKRRSDYIRASRVSYFRNPEPNVTDYSANKFDKMNTRQAVKILREKNPFNPADFNSYDKALDSKKFDGIVYEFESYLKNNPNDTDALSTYGYLLFAKSHFALDAAELRSNTLRAETVLEKAIAINPDHWRARMSLAILYQLAPVEMSFTDKGISLLENLISYQETQSIKPEFAFSYVSLSYLYEQSGEINKAMDTRYRGSLVFPGIPFFYEPEKQARQYSLH